MKPEKKHPLGKFPNSECLNVYAELLGLNALAAGGSRQVFLAAASGIPHLRPKLPSQFEHKLNGVFVAFLYKLVEVFRQTFGEGHLLELIAVFSPKLLEPHGIGIGGWWRGHGPILT